MKKLEILIVEDEEASIRDARAEVAKHSGELSADFAATFKEAEALLKTKRYDGIISDVFFPYQATAAKPGAVKGWSKEAADAISKHLSGILNEIRYHASDEYDSYSSRIFNRTILAAAKKWMTGESMHPTGVLMTESALQKGIPIVLCTSTYHHGYATEPINSYRSRKGIMMVDVYQPSLDDEEKRKATGEGVKKNWARAIDLLLEKIQSPGGDAR